MDDQWDESRCNDRSGFLFSHECLQSPTGRCSTCNRPVCDEHTRVDNDDLLLCTTCAKKLLSPRQRGGNSGAREAGRAGQYRSHDRWERDDPYFYGGYYYSGWGYYGPGYWGHSSYRSATNHDPNDFTESDSQALMGDGDDADGFESDMTES